MDEKISVEGRFYTSETPGTWSFDFVDPIDGSQLTRHLEIEDADSLHSLGSAVRAEFPHYVGRWDVYTRDDSPASGWLRVSPDGTVNWGWL